MYDGDYETANIWSDSGWWVKGEADWDHNGEWDPLEDDEWWIDQEIYLNTDKYSRTLTLALFGPSSVDYVEPEVDKEWGEVLYKKAWLDNFVWTPDVGNIFFQISPSPGGGVSFPDTLQVLCYSDYRNFLFYYSTDGSMPTTSSALYDPMKGITIDKTSTVKVVIFENGKPVNDTVYSGLYTKKVGELQLALEQQPFSGSPVVHFSSATLGAVFYYALGGAQPQRLESGAAGPGTYVGSSVVVTGDTTISVLAVAPGAVNSEVVTRTFSKLAKPTLTCRLDGQAYSEPAVFEQQAKVTMTGPAGTTLFYRLDGGAEWQYSGELTFSAAANISVQARKDGMISSDVVTLSFAKAFASVTLPALVSGGWQVFSVPGELSQARSDALIAARKPLAYDAARRVYARASRIRGGAAYWVFVPTGGLPAVALPIAPLASVSVPARRWAWTGSSLLDRTWLLPAGGPFQLHRWNPDGKRFERGDEMPAFDGGWLYNSGNTPGGL